MSTSPTPDWLPTQHWHLLQITTLSAKGQITIARKLQRQLGLNDRDPLGISVVRGAIHLTPLRRAKDPPKPTQEATSR